MRRIHWTSYLTYRSSLRGFDLEGIEAILRFTDERYTDTATGRLVAVGRHGKQLVAIPYETSDDTMTPVTIHSTSRQQITVRLASGRYRHHV